MRLLGPVSPPDVTSSIQPMMRSFGRAIGWTPGDFNSTTRTSPLGSVRASEDAEDQWRAARFSAPARPLAFRPLSSRRFSTDASAETELLRAPARADWGRPGLWMSKEESSLQAARVSAERAISASAQMFEGGPHSVTPTPMAIDHRPPHPCREQHDQHDRAERVRPQWHDRRPGVSRMNEHVERGQDEQRDVADRMRPRRRLGADRPIAQKIDRPENGGEKSHDNSDGHQPGRKIRPHHVCRPPIGQVGQKHADEAGDRTGTSIGWMGCRKSCSVEGGFLATDKGIFPSRPELGVLQQAADSNGSCDGRSRRREPLALRRLQVLRRKTRYQASVAFFLRSARDAEAGEAREHHGQGRDGPWGRGGGSRVRPAPELNRVDPFFDIWQ